MEPLADFTASNTPPPKTGQVRRSIGLTKKLRPPARNRSSLGAATNDAFPLPQEPFAHAPRGAPDESGAGEPLDAPPSALDSAGSVDIFLNGVRPKARRATIGDANDVYPTSFGPLELQEFDRLPPAQREKLYFVARLKPLVSPDSSIIDYLSRIDMSKVSRLMQLGSVFSYLSASDAAGATESKRTYLPSHAETTLKRPRNEELLSRADEPGVERLRLRFTDALFSDSSESEYSAARGSKPLSNPMSSSRTTPRIGKRLIEMLPGPLDFLSDVRSLMLSLTQIQFICSNKKLVPLASPKHAVLEDSKRVAEIAVVFAEFATHVTEVFHEYEKDYPFRQTQLREVKDLDFFIRKALLGRCYQLLRTDYCHALSQTIHRFFHRKYSACLACPQLLISESDSSMNIVEKLNVVFPKKPSADFAIDSALVEQFVQRGREHDVLRLIESQDVNFDDYIANYEAQLSSRCRAILDQSGDRFVAQSQASDAVAEFLLKIKYEVRKAFCAKFESALQWRSKNAQNAYDLALGGPEFADQLHRGLLVLRSDRIVPQHIASALRLGETKTVPCFGGIELCCPSAAKTRPRRSVVRKSIYNPNAYSSAFLKKATLLRKLETQRNMPLSPLLTE